MSTQAHCLNITADVSSKDYPLFAKYIHHNVGFIPYRLIDGLRSDGVLSSLEPSLVVVFMKALESEGGVSFS
jgi:hypothetical protein